MKARIKNLMLALIIVLQILPVKVYANHNLDNESMKFKFELQDGSISEITDYGNIRKNILTKSDGTQYIAIYNKANKTIQIEETIIKLQASDLFSTNFVDSIDNFRLSYSNGYCNIGDKKVQYYDILARDYAYLRHRKDFGVALIVTAIGAVYPSLFAIGASKLTSIAQDIYISIDNGDYGKKVTIKETLVCMEMEHDLDPFGNTFTTWISSKIERVQ